jgi:integrase
VVSASISVRADCGKGWRAAWSLAGCPSDLVQEFLGHVSVDTTQVLYAVPPSAAELDVSWRNGDGRLV